MKHIARFFKAQVWILVLVWLVSNANSQVVDIDAQIAERKLRRPPQISPPDVSFTIRFVNDQKQFRQGEVIRLEMRFASSSPETYRLDRATYDRSGRLNLDNFHIEPTTGFTDPMRDHLSFIGGGLRGTPDLEEKPYVIVYDLNEWFRFDQPGTYRLYLTSPRVSRKDQRFSLAGGDITMTSNIVEFEIVKPEAGWAEKELQKILKNLNGKADRRTACRALRFLGTKETVPELVRRYDAEDQECAFEFYAGLVSSPHKDLVIETMAGRLVAPDQAVSSQWLNLLVSLGSPPWLAPDSYNEEQAKAYWQRYLEIRSRLETKYAEKLAKAVALKVGKARAISLNTLLGLRWDKTKLPDVSTFFSELPLQDQRRLLDSDWKQISSASLLPTLRRTYLPHDAGKTEDDYEKKELSTLALQRIYELAPEEGRRLILAELKRPSPRVGLSALTLLPDETLPELDQVFMGNFERGEQSEVQGALIERYGSSGLYSRVSALLADQAGKMACFEQNHLLAYCLRIDGAGGEALIRQALNTRERTHCYPGVLNQVAELHFSPEVEKLALEVLNDSNLEIVISAVNVLGKYGSSEAEAPLWKKFEQWSQTWGKRGGELDSAALENESLQSQSQLEQALQSALGQAAGWLTSPKELVRLKQLCVTRQKQEDVDRWLQKWSDKIVLRFMPYDNEWGRAEVGHYRLSSLEALKQKLAQFPKGTVFHWQTANNGYFEEAKEELFQTVQAFLVERSLQLVR